MNCELQVRCQQGNNAEILNIYAFSIHAFAGRITGGHFYACYFVGLLVSILVSKIFQERLNLYHPYKEGQLYTIT